MAQAGHLYQVASVDGTHFTDALAQNAFEAEGLTLPGAIGGGARAASRVKALVIISSQNLAWEVQVFGAHDGPSADPNEDEFRGLWTFTAADAVAIGGNFYYYIDGLDIPYEDMDLAQHLGNALNTGGVLVPATQVPQFHLRLVNRSTAAKSSYGAGSHVRLILSLEPTHGGS